MAETFLYCHVVIVTQEIRYTVLAPSSKQDCFALLTVELNDLESIFQPKLFCGSSIIARN